MQPGQSVHRFVWHDRKAWWQQEQAILAYLILHGSCGDSEYQKHAREAAAFYNAFFLDHEDGGVYFNTLANGLPYLVGNERLKGSHSMSGYHSMELCYLAAVYTNLLITKQPMYPVLQAVSARLQGPHPASVAGHSAAGQRQHRAAWRSTASRTTISTPTGSSCAAGHDVSRCASR